MEINVNVEDENAFTGIGNFHRALLTKTLDLTQDASERAATNMKIRMPHATMKTAEGVHTTGPTLRRGPFGHPEVQYTAETDPRSAAQYFYWGTGLWGPTHRKIFASTYGKKAFLFKRNDGGNFTSVVRGQPPQKLWFFESVDNTNNYVRLRITAMLNELKVTPF